MILGKSAWGDLQNGESGMTEKILAKMKRGVYYPGNHLGKKGKLTELEAKGYLERMEGSFLCGPDSEPNYCLTDKGLSYKGRKLK